MPCKPPIAFVNIVGHAIFQTAGRSGPSMIDRSNRGLPEVSFKLAYLRQQTCTADLLCDCCKLGSRSAPAQLINILKQRRVRLQDRKLLEEQRERTVLFVESLRRKIFERAVTIDQLRRSLRTTTGNPRKTIRRITHEREVVGNKPRLDTKLCAHRFRVPNHAAAPVDLNNTIVNYALRQI